MTWTPEQAQELKNMCFAGIKNADMAAHFGVAVMEIHAKRSQMGITIPKVKAALVGGSREELAAERKTETLREKLGLAYEMADGAVKAELRGKGGRHNYFYKLLGIRSGLVLARLILSSPTLTKDQLQRATTEILTD